MNDSVRLNDSVGRFIRACRKGSSDGPRWSFGGEKRQAPAETSVAELRPVTARRLRSDNPNVTLGLTWLAWRRVEGEKRKWFHGYILSPHTIRSFAFSLSSLSHTHLRLSFSLSSSRASRCSEKKKLCTHTLYVRAYMYTSRRTNATTMVTCRWNLGGRVFTHDLFINLWDESMDCCKLNLACEEREERLNIKVFKLINWLK